MGLNQRKIQNSFLKDEKEKERSRELNQLINQSKSINSINYLSRTVIFSNSLDKVAGYFESFCYSLGEKSLHDSPYELSLIAMDHSATRDDHKKLSPTLKALQKT